MAHFVQFVPFKMLISACCFGTIKHISQLYAETDKQKLLAREMIGLVHAFIASSLALFAFLSQPSLLDDLILNTNVWAEHCVAIGTGYFLADTIIIIFKWCTDHGARDSSNAIILVHHLAALVTFNFAMYVEKFMGYSTMCFILEGSSIFLKARKIWKIKEYPGIGHASYHLLATLNMAAFIIFRLFVVIYAIFWWYHNIHRLSILYTILPSVGSVMVAVINVRYFQLLVKSDLLPMLKHAKSKLQ